MGLESQPKPNPGAAAARHIGLMDRDGWRARSGLSPKMPRPRVAFGAISVLAKEVERDQAGLATSLMRHWWVAGVDCAHVGVEPSNRRIATEPKRTIVAP